VANLRKRSFRQGRLSEHTVEALEAMISEEFPQPGSRLPKEAELADRFAVSRIVIREAMKILEDRGLVEVRAGRGTLTLAPSPEKVKDALLRLFKDQPIPTVAEMESLLELRQTLEESVAALAAARATPEDLAAMEQALAGMCDGVPETAQIEADLRFHQSVTKAAHNRYFEMVLEPLTHVFLQQIKLTNSYQVGLDLHRHIFETIREGDQVGARQAVRRLARDTRDHTRIAINLLNATCKKA
jgi:GntR family transcriptional repressor for pyruvate dehydrogenase complex